MCQMGCRYEVGPEGDCGLSSRQLRTKMDGALCQENEPPDIEPVKKSCETCRFLEKKPGHVSGICGTHVPCGPGFTEWEARNPTPLPNGVKNIWRHKEFGRLHFGEGIINKNLFWDWYGHEVPEHIADEFARGLK